MDRTSIYDLLVFSMDASKPNNVYENNITLPLLKHCTDIYTTKIVTPEMMLFIIVFKEISLFLQRITVAVSSVTIFILYISVQSFKINMMTG